MEIKLSPQTIELLANVISGGLSNSSDPPVGLYRSAYKLEKYMRECNVDFSVGSMSRMPALVEHIQGIEPLSISARPTWRLKIDPS